MSRRRYLFALTKLIYVVLLGLLLSGCGFHLRGYPMVPPQMRLIYIEVGNPLSPFSIQLRRELISMGVIIAPTPMQAPVVLQILTDSFDNRLTAISENTQTRAYILSYGVDFQLKDRQGQVIYGPQHASSSLPYSSSDARLLGDTQVFLQDQSQLRHEIIMQIFRMLNSNEGRQGLQHIT